MIEPLESRIAPAGIVDVVVAGGSLSLKTLAAGDGDEQIVITAGPNAGEFVVDPAAGTKLRFNGVELPDGNSQLVSGVTKGMAVALGAGADVLTMNSLSFGGSVKVDLGAGGGTYNAIAAILGPLAIKGSGGAFVDLGNATVAGSVKLETGAGTSSVLATGLTVAGDFSYKGGPAADSLVTISGGGNFTVGGKVSVALGAGMNALNLATTMAVGRDASFTGGDDADFFVLGGSGNRFFGGSLTVNTGKGNDVMTLDVNGSVQVARDLTVTSGGKVADTDDVAHSVLGALGVSIGGKVTFSSGPADNVNQTINSLTRDTVIGGSVTYKAAGTSSIQLLGATRTLAVGGAVSMTTAPLASGQQFTFGGSESASANSFINGPATFLGGTGVTLQMAGDLRAGVTIKTSTVDPTATVDIGTANAGFAARIFGPVKVTLPGGATSDNSLVLTSTTLFGALTVLGSAGIDRVSVRDTTVLGAATIDVGAGNDEVNLEFVSQTSVATRFLGALTIKGGAGMDSFQMGTFNLNDSLAFRGPVVIDGGADTDVLTIDPTVSFLYPAIQLNLP